MEESNTKKMEDKDAGRTESSKTAQEKASSRKKKKKSKDDSDDDDDEDISTSKSKKPHRLFIVRSLLANSVLSALACSKRMTCLPKEPSRPQSRNK